MAFKTSEEMMQLCKQLREKSGMTQTEFGAGVKSDNGTVLSRTAVGQAETDPRPRYDSLRIAILEQKGGYSITPGFDLKKTS